MSTSPERHPVETRGSRAELGHVLERLDTMLSALKVEIDNVRRVIDDRKT